MTLWLIYQSNDVKKNEWYINQYLQLGKEVGLEIELVLTNELTMICKEGTFILLRNNQQVELPRAAIIRAIEPKLSRFLESMGIRVFNRAIISEICNDKARTYQEIVPLHIPMIPTICCKHNDFGQVLEHIELPAVVKTVDGHGGQEVFLIHTIDTLVNEIIDTTTSDYVVQPLVGMRHQDLRVYVLGNNILSAILRTSSDGFKANYSLGGTVQEYELKEVEREIVEKILQKFSFDLVGIDFIIGDDGELIFNEIEDVVGARMLYQCTDINLVLEYLKYIKQQLCDI